MKVHDLGSQDGERLSQLLCLLRSWRRPIGLAGIEDPIARDGHLWRERPLGEIEPKHSVPLDSNLDSAPHRPANYDLMMNLRVQSADRQRIRRFADPDSRDTEVSFDSWRDPIRREGGVVASPLQELLVLRQSHGQLKV